MRMGKHVFLTEQRHNEADVLAEYLRLEPVEKHRQPQLRR
jgi:hypothetical protein